MRRRASEAKLPFGFFVTVVGLLCIWASSGYIIARCINGTGARIIAGAVAGIASVAILWLTSFVLNNLLTDRMSYEPDRIRAFQQSGPPTNPVRFMAVLSASLGARSFVERPRLLSRTVPQR